MSSLFDPTLEKALKEDRQWLESTQLPIVTLSGTYREDVKEWHKGKGNETTPDIVFSRAHFSMALGLAVTAWGANMNHAKAWMVDPTNYVSSADWSNIQLTEAVGKTVARHSVLKGIKDLIDQHGRKKLPILQSITPPLLYLTEHVTRPILCLHPAVANLLAAQGKQVIHVLTDPYVRPENLDHADNPQVMFCVFDQITKDEFLEKSLLAGKTIDPNRIIVTGPTIDPRVLKAKSQKPVWRSGPLRLCITTGGLGTNKEEIETILAQLLPIMKTKPELFSLLIYAGTQPDIAQMVRNQVHHHKLRLGRPDQITSPIRLLYHPQLFNANELLITHAFPWAHGFITKPSGDMAYDAVASGSFLLTLSEWGDWEGMIRTIFEQKGVARKAQPDHFLGQLELLMSAQGRSQSWIERAMLTAHPTDPLFKNGAQAMINVTSSFK